MSPCILIGHAPQIALVQEKGVWTNVLMFLENMCEVECEPALQVLPTACKVPLLANWAIVEPSCMQGVIWCQSKFTWIQGFFILSNISSYIFTSYIFCH